MIEELLHPVGPALGQVEGDAADAGVVVGQPRAAELLGEVVYLLALAQGVHEGRERADVTGVRADADEVARDAVELARDRSQVPRPRRDLEAEQLLHRHRPALVGEHRREVVDPIRVRHELRVLQQFADLLDAAVQVSDLRHRALHHLAVGLDEEVDDAVRGRVLRPHVQEHQVVRVAEALDQRLVDRRAFHGREGLHLGAPVLGSGLAAGGTPAPGAATPALLASDTVAGGTPALPEGRTLAWEMPW